MKKQFSHISLVAVLILAAIIVRLFMPHAHLFALAIAFIVALAVNAVLYIYGINKKYL